ncbi:MAG: sulfatase-like hydrolase/transferase [Parabacteroides sp.]|nr:sulfatase-like hydrolase/transferase [Parabacteroides sp.]
MKTPIAAFSCLALAAVPVTARERVQKPNVIYIYADDMGKGMISAYGQSQFTTPRIDALIKNGTSFENAYGCMFSAPARASLMTGYHDCRPDKWKITQAGQYAVAAEDTAVIASREAAIDAEDVRLAAPDLYLPQVFKKAGYVTGQVGKLDWGFTATRNQLRAHGWDYYYGYLDHVRCHGFYPPFLFDNDSIVLLEGNTHPDCAKTIEPETPGAYRERWNMAGKKTYSEDVFDEKAIGFIRDHRDEPFFLFYPSQLPHGPVSVPAVYPELADNPNLTPIEKEYGSMVKRLDDTVGKLMDEIKRLGIAGRTIFIFAADNGHEIYYAQKGRCEKPYRDVTNGELFDNYAHKYYSVPAGDVFNGNAGRAGLKRSNLEGGIHIPLVFYGEGSIPEGVVCREVVSNYDLLPTVADWLGVPLPVEKDGKSLLPALLEGKSLGSRYLVFSSMEGPAILTSDGWKLRSYAAEQAFELFYLPDDPQERTDLSERFPEWTAALRELLLKECGGDFRNGLYR